MNGDHFLNRYFFSQTCVREIQIKYTCTRLMVIDSQLHTQRGPCACFCACSALVRCRALWHLNLPRTLRPLKRLLLFLSRHPRFHTFTGSARLPNFTHRIRRCVGMIVCSICDTLLCLRSMRLLKALVAASSPATCLTGL